MYKSSYLLYESSDKAACHSDLGVAGPLSLSFQNNDFMTFDSLDFSFCDTKSSVTYR